MTVFASEFQLEMECCMPHIQCSYVSFTEEKL